MILTAFLALVAVLLPHGILENVALTACLFSGGYELWQIFSPRPALSDERM